MNSRISEIRRQISNDDAPSTAKMDCPRLRDNDKQKNSSNFFKGGCHAMQQKQEKIAPLGAGICGPLRRAGNGGGRQRLGRPNRDGAALVYGQRRAFSHRLILDRRRSLFLESSHLYQVSESLTPAADSRIGIYLIHHGKQLSRGL